MPTYPSFSTWAIEAPDWVEFSDSYNGSFMSAEQWNEHIASMSIYYKFPRSMRCTADTPGLSGTVKVTCGYQVLDKEFRWHGEFTVER